MDFSFSEEEEALRLEVQSFIQEHFTEEGQTYYYNVSSGESTWEYPKPAGAEEVQICSQYQEADGSWYWYNSSTAESIPV